MSEGFEPSIIRAKRRVLGTPVGQRSEINQMNDLLKKID